MSHHRLSFFYFMVTGFGDRVSQCSLVNLDLVIQTRLDLNSQTYLSEIFILLGLKLCTTTADPESVSHKTKTNVSVVLFISFSQPQVQS